MKKYLFVSSLVLIILAMTGCEKNNSGTLTGYWGSKQYLKENGVDYAISTDREIENGELIEGVRGLHFIDKNTVERGYISAYKSYVGSTSKYKKLCSENYRGYNIVYVFEESLGVCTYEKIDNTIYLTNGEIYTIVGDKLYLNQSTYYSSYPLEKLSE